MPVTPTENYTIVDGNGRALNGVCSNIEEAEAHVAEIQQTSTADQIIIIRTTITPVAVYDRSVDWTVTDMTTP